jgi:protein-tyrosine-phosphatase
MKTVLFVCVENSCRSQMAEAYAKMLGGGVIEAHSSGSRPSGKVNEKAIASMKEVGYDLSSHKSKSLDEIPPIEYDVVVTMGCGDECPFVRARQRLEWNIPDPKKMEMEEFGEVRDRIRAKVVHLIESCSTARRA